MNKYKFEHVVNNIVAVSLIIVSVFTFGCSSTNKDISIPAVAKDFKPVAADRLIYPYDKTQYEATSEVRALAKLHAKQEAEFTSTVEAKSVSQPVSLDCFCTLEHREAVSRGAFQSPLSHVFTPTELNQASLSIWTFTHQIADKFTTSEFRISIDGRMEVAFTNAGYYVIAQPVKVLKRGTNGLLQLNKTVMLISCEPARKQTTFVIPNTQLHPVSAYVDGHFIECDGHNNYKVTVRRG